MALLIYLWPAPVFSLVFIFVRTILTRFLKSDPNPGNIWRFSNLPSFPSPSAASLDFTLFQLLLLYLKSYNIQCGFLHTTLFRHSSAICWFKWESVLQACLHKHVFIQISIWWTPCFLFSRITPHTKSQDPTIQAVSRLLVYYSNFFADCVSQHPKTMIRGFVPHTCSVSILSVSFCCPF